MRIPIYKTELMPGRHWIWDSFKAKLAKVSTIMILNGHILPRDILQFRSAEENLLNHVMAFDHVDVLNHDNDGTGVYIIVDKKGVLLMTFFINLHLTCEDTL